MIPPHVAVLASGNGSNLQAILDATQEGTLNATVRLVFSDKAAAFALERAKKFGVEALSLSPKSFPSREVFDQAVVGLLQERKIEWVVCAGYMRIISPVFVRAFKGRILNIHPALLPKYPGTHSIERAIEAGDLEIGVTVHFIDEGVDTGPIIEQSRIQISPGETLDAVTERVHELEHRLYPKALERVFSGKVRYEERTK